MMRAPLSASSKKTRGPPIEVRVDLPSLQQMLELAQARERRGVEVPVGHGDVLEQAAQLLSASPSVPLATEAGQDPLDLVEGHAVAAIVAAVVAEDDFAIGEGLADRLGDLADPVVVVVVADIEDLVGYRLARRLKGGGDRRADIAHMHQWPPRHAVAGHGYAASCPRQPGQVVQHDVEANAR